MIVQKGGQGFDFSGEARWSAGNNATGCIFRKRKKDISGMYSLRESNRVSPALLSLKQDPSLYAYQNTGLVD